MILRTQEGYRTLPIQLWKRLITYCINTTMMLQREPVENSVVAEVEEFDLSKNGHRPVLEYSRGKRIHDLFEEQVGRSPDAIAVIFGDELVRYRNLDARANQLARFLLQLGTTPEDRIGICIRRSLDMLVAMLAVLKAGAAYVPLDPLHPVDRLKYVAADSNVGIILTEGHLRALVSTLGTRVVTLDTDSRAVDSQRTEPLRLDFSSDSLAYVMYTSGSTGRPKGVMVTHRNVVSFFGGMDQHLASDTPGVWLAITSISFDISILELLWTLARGFRIILQETNYGLLISPSQSTLTAGTGPRANPSYSIPEQIIRHGVTHMQCTPSLARIILNTPGGRPALATLEKLLIGGEALPASLAKELHDVGTKEIWNMYGPTETTIWSTMQKLHRDDTVISIGGPLANTSILVLDENQTPVPVGVPGELYIGGDGVARGYLNNVDLTAERFVEIPALAEGDIFYRTGDMVCYLPDGRLQFLGRLDNQVKIRGHRIELGEIEATLSQHHGVAEAIVSAVDDLHQERSLVAYLTPRNGDLPVAELREFLRSKLPPHMVPSFFVVLPAFPLTPNGKVDRFALPRVRSLDTDNAIAPADEVEARLADIWCKVLGLTSISVNDDYFELGGDSLAATYLVLEVNLQFNTELPLGTLLHAPTIRKMADSIRDFRGSSLRSAVVPIQPNGTKPRLFCIGPLNGEVLLFRKLAMELGPDQPLYGLEPFGLSRTASGLVRIESIAAYYIEQMKTLAADRPYSLLGYSFGGLVAVEMAQQLRTKGGFVPRVVLIDAGYPAGCKEKEQFQERLRRYTYHLGIFTFGPNRLHHLRSRLKIRSFRTAYRAASIVGAPSPTLAKTIVDKQQIASDNYRARPYPGRVYLFKAESGSQFLNGGPELGWKGILSDLVIHQVPGDHGTINTGNNLKILAQQLATWLE